LQTLPRLVPFAPFAITTLTAELKTGETTLHAAAAAPSVLQATGQFRIVVGNEIMIVTAGAGGTSWTVTRKAEGTTEVAHAVGATIYYILSAGSIGGQSNPAANIPGLRTLGVNPNEAAPGNVVPLNAIAYGAIGDARTFSDATISEGSLSQLHSTHAVFTTADVGKAVSIANAGAVGTGSSSGAHGPLITTITSVSGGVATLNTAATVAVTNVNGIVGTDNAVPFQNAVAAARTTGVGLRIPGGSYLVTQRSPMKPTRSIL
jgi:hypothetical protein